MKVACLVLVETVALPQFYFIGLFMKLSEDDRRQLSEMVTVLFDHWNLQVNRKGAPIAND